MIKLRGDDVGGILKETILIVFSVIAGGIITLIIENKTSKQSIYQNFKFEYFLKLYELILELANYILDLMINDNIDLEKALSVSRYLNVDFEFVQEIRNDFKKIEDEIIRLHSLQLELAGDINKVKNTKNITDENELYSDERVKEILEKFYNKKGEVLEKTIRFRYDVSKKMDIKTLK